MDYLTEEYEPQRNKPLLNPKDFYIIFKAMSEDSEMGHWQLIMRTKTGHIYFCSFGSELTKNVSNWIKLTDDLIDSRVVNLQKNISNLQSHKSYLCGFYVLYILNQLMKTPVNKLEEKFRNLMYEFKIRNFEDNHKILRSAFQ